jgi:DNA repair exonuclease SbcCD ATPase subunit
MEQEEKSVHSALERPRMDVIPTPSRSPFPETTRAESASLDKIRDILFGPQSRDYDKRFIRLEERLLKEAAELREDLGKRYDTLESYIKREMEALSERLKTEQQERADAGRKLAGELQELRDSVDKKTAQLAEQASFNQRELREQILERFRTLSDELQQKSRELSASLERYMRELRTDKADRTMLAALFTEVAMRLNNDWQLSGADSDR